MKIRPSIIGFTVIAAVLIALMLWFGEKQPVEIPPPVSTATNIAPPTVVISNQSVAAPVFTNKPVVQTTKGADLPNNPPLSKEEKAIGLLSDYNDQPIVFYGKIEDQFSNVVSDVVVSFDVRVMNGHESTVKRGQIISDANGLFMISGYKGQDLAMAVKKAGYTFVSMNGSGIYSKMWPEEQRAHPDPNNPTIIQMWKLQKAEPLVGIDKTFKLPYTTVPMNFDLIAGQTVSSGGDLRITVNRPAGVISGRNPQDWSIDIKVVDGGFIETLPEESTMTYVAPENGYQPSGTFGKNNGPDLVDKTLFIQSRNGQVYSKIHLLFGINDTPDGFMNITFSGVANTNGSRNWEATAPQ